MKTKTKAIIIVYWFLLVIPLIFANLIVRPIYFWTNKNTQNIPSNKQNLENHVKFLTTPHKQRTYENLTGLNKVANYIHDNLKTYWCDELKYQLYEVQNKEYKNIICIFKGESDEKIIVWAHYDVYWEYSLTWFMEFWTYSWADDNASWIAGLLELARLVWKNKANLKNTIEFVAYTLEEPPFFDSEKMWSFIHAKSLKEKWEKVKYMIALEMIWYFSESDIQEYPIAFLKRLYPSKWNFIAIIWKMFDSEIKGIKKSMLENSSIDTRSLSSPDFVPWIDFSDHRNYWYHWYKAYMVTDTSFYRNKNYHTKFDTIETLDFDKMNEVVKGVYGGIMR